jgi:hypothetical protein
VTPPRRRRRNDPGWPPGGVIPPAPSTIDLHTHTTRSDGVLGPATLVGAAWAAGVRILALTDHDTLAGYRDVVASRAAPAGMTLIPGVEINALVPSGIDLWEAELHILGFGMDPADDAFEATLAAQRDQRRLRFARTVDRLREIGLPIDAQVANLDPTDDDALGRPTIARALMRAGFATSVEDAFSRLIGFGGPAYVRREGLGPNEAITAIRAAGGLPVLAHFREAPARPDVIDELVEAGLAGLEVYYRSFDAKTIEAVGAIATARGMLATGGTDYHGDLGPYAESHAMLWVPPEAGAALLGRLAGGSTV